MTKTSAPNIPSVPSRRVILESDPTPDQMEAEALQMVLRQQKRIQAAAHNAFRKEPDPLRSFAEEVAQSSVTHIRAVLYANAAHAKRMKIYNAPGSGNRVNGQASETPVPAANFLALLGIHPVDVLRFRAWALGIIFILSLALLGTGALIGWAGTHCPTPT